VNGQSGQTATRQLDRLAKGVDRPVVSQALCSALPVAYGDLPARHWRPFAKLVLEAAYEATLLAGVLNMGKRVVNPP
jgi:hypothetical protein